MDRTSLSTWRSSLCPRTDCAPPRGFHGQKAACLVEPGSRRRPALTSSVKRVELLQADSARREGIHTVLRGTAVVMGGPRKVVVRQRRRTSACRSEASTTEDGPPSHSV